MSSKEEQQNKKAEWVIKEIRNLIDDGLESGLFIQPKMPYIYTTSAARDLNREYDKYCTTTDSTIATDKEKGLHRFLLSFSGFPKSGQDASQYGKGIMLLDIGRIFENCILYYTPIEGGGIIIVRILLHYP